MGAACASPAPPDGFFVGASPNAPETPEKVSVSRTLTVFAAASLRDALEAIGKAFETENPGVSVRFNFANSHALRLQIEEGAAADVFASASPKETDALLSRGALADLPIPFAGNVLTIVVPPGNPADIRAVQDLAHSGVKLVLAAEEVPVGAYARFSIGKLAAEFGPSFEEAVLGNVVSNEDSVKQVVAKVQLGEADAGIVFASDAVAAPELGTVAIPMEQNVVATYPIAVLTGASNTDLAKAFVEHVLSLRGQAILREWGFLPSPRQD